VFYLQNSYAMTPETLIAPARLARRPVLATQTDTRLVDLVRAGYEPAFETIVSRYRAALLRYTERFLSHERAEDAVQQSFVSAYEAMLRDDAALNLRPWLYRIAHNASLNALRDRGLRHSELDESIDGVERPDQALERTQGLREVLDAVQALPERQREAIVLRELEGRSYEEIASELGVTDGSVRQLLNRARNTLRAGATAVVPVGLLLRLPWVAPAEPLAARVAELGVGAGAGAVMAKVCAMALVTGAVVGGVAVAPEGGNEPQAGGSEATAPGGEPGGRDAPSPSAGPAPGSSGGSSGDDTGEGGGARAERDRSGRGGSEDRSGRGGGDEEEDTGGGQGPSSSSGPGSGGGSESESESGGESGGGSGGGSSSRSSSVSGSGSGSESSGSGSGSAFSESGSDSGNSGSGDSGSGSEDSRSGSGDSGSG
jgi:RNA polymerase sigma factor (sigma-70 family)